MMIAMLLQQMLSSEQLQQQAKKQLHGQMFFQRILFDYFDIDAAGKNGWWRSRSNPRVGSSE